MYRITCVVISAAILFAGCSLDSGKGKNSKDGSQASTNSYQLIATTGQINSALKKLTQGTDCQIKLFCGPGVDPHSFSASTKDVQAMQNADAIYYNGYHLEAKLSDHLDGSFKSKSWAMSSAFPEKDRLQWIEDGKVDPAAPYDPHIWNHLPGWSVCVQALAEQLAELDPQNANLYRQNCDAYLKEMNEVHQWAARQLKEIPADRRFIVSAHDAFNYFAQVYQMETMAVLGIGNDPEADIKTMREVAETVADRKIPVIFMEAINNPKVTTALKEACDARGWSVKIASKTLYSDDLGEQAPQDTFLGAFKSNVEVISASLK